MIGPQTIAPYQRAQVKCTLADRHFCTLNIGLYHINTSQWCVTALFFKDNNKISNHCKTDLTILSLDPRPITFTKAYGLSLLKHLYLRKSSGKDHSHIKTLEPPFTLINLQPTCSAFSSVIKFPPYFKQYSSGLHVALKSANLHIPKCTHSSYRVWTHFDLSNVTKPKIKNLRKLAPAPNIPITQLRAKIANFRQITSDTDRHQIHYVGGGSGSGLVLLIVICCLLYWCCKRTQKLETRSPACVTNADVENPNMLHTKVGAIGTNVYSVPGRETIGIQDPVGTQCMVLSNYMQFANTSALLDQLEDYGTNVRALQKTEG